MDFNTEFDNFKKNARDTFSDHKDEAMRYAKRETRKHLDDFLGDDDSNFNAGEREHQSRDYETKRKNNYDHSSSYSYNEEKSLGDNDYYGDNHYYNNSNNYQTENDYFNNDDYKRDDNYYNNNENYRNYNYHEHENEDY